MRAFFILCAVLLAAQSAVTQEPCRDDHGKFVACPPEPVDDPDLATPIVHHDEVPPLTPVEPMPPPDVAVVLGGMTVLGQGETIVEPFARLFVDWQLAGRRRALHAHVVADLTALPDSELRLDDASTFNAAEVAFLVRYKPIPRLAASAFVEGGFASRFPRDALRPVTSAPLWASFGAYFIDRGESGGRFKVGVGPDERLGYGWTMAVQAAGMVRLVGIGDFGVTLMIDFIGGLESNPTGQRVNVVRAMTGVSWNRRGSP